MPQRRTLPPWWFVSLSLLLHAGFLALSSQPSTPITTRYSGDIAIHLVEAEQPKPVTAKQAEKQPAATTPQPAPNPKPYAALVNTTSKSAQEARAIVERHAPSTRETIAKAEDAESDAVDEAARQSSLKVTLQQEIARHFTYPQLARKHGWQGEVLLAFRLEADGRIIDAHIARSSGYEILDRAALTALGKVKQINSGSNGFAMQLPVIYRLEG